jgi:hypothetical protein
MGKRSAVVTSEAEATSLTLSELNRQIALLNSALKVVCLPLVWLEEQRERLYAVPAPKRKF